MDVRLEGLLGRQAGLVGWWQMGRLGMSHDAIRHFAAKARQVGDGVYLTGHAPLTREQLRWAAVLTAPQTYLAHASAGDAWGFRPWCGLFEVVVRPGSGGPRRFGDVLVCRSKTLAGNTTTRGGLPITTPERTIVDLAARLHHQAARKLVREAIRLRVTTFPALARQIHEAKGRRGTAKLREYVQIYCNLPFGRCKSDAEAMGLEVLANAQRPTPNVNVDIANEEADFSWPNRRLIIEIDGPQFHLFAEEDGRKQASWEAAGWRVRRIPSGRVFDAPRELVRLYDEAP